MGADQIAAIRPAIAEIEQTRAGEEWCASFEVPDSTYWVQVVPGTVNLSYPYTDDPAARLLCIGRDSHELRLLNWQPGKYATFTYVSRTNSELARLVDRVFVMLFGCDDDTYEIDVSLERL
jgi:hypothetical protein